MPRLIYKANVIADGIAYLVTESEVLKCLSDEKSRDMLSVVRDKGMISAVDFGLTRKQYYSRLHGLIICGLIKKNKSKYQLTSFGKVVFDLHLVIKNTITNQYWKFKAFDAIASSGIPESQLSEMMCNLVEDEKD
jgi:predicted transcriptional regulator